MKKILFLFVSLWPFTFVAVFLAFQGDWQGVAVVLLAMTVFCSLYDIFLFAVDRNKRRKGESWWQFRQRSLEETSRYMELQKQKDPQDFLVPSHAYVRLDCGHIHYVNLDPDVSLESGGEFWCHAHSWLGPARLQHIVAIENFWDLTPEELDSVKS